MSDILNRLENTINDRVTGAENQNSHTWRMYQKGPLKCAQKFGEEAVEAVIAAATADKAELISESADCLYHMLLMLKSNDVSLNDVYAELERREGISGVEEKESRVK